MRERGAGRLVKPSTLDLCGRLQADRVALGVSFAYGTVTDHGTMFVGFSADQRRLAAMLESMAGVAGGARDALRRYTCPLTGAYYFIPSIESFRRTAAARALAT
jgi:deferrochelatase/peroxidase EfeB